MMGLNEGRRYGKIKVSESVYKQFWNTDNKIIPYRVEFNHCDKSFHIECEHELFDLVKEGEVLPEYYLNFETISCLPKENKGISAKNIIVGVERV